MYQKMLEVSYKQEKMIEERRKHQRTKGQILVKIADKVFDIITETTDISPAGTYCRVTRLLPLMSKIDVILLVPTRTNGRQNRKMRCKGVVVRTEPVILKDTDKAHYNVAIFFTEILKKDQKIIESYINAGHVSEEKVPMIN